MTERPTKTAGTRITQLDGLRGVASLVVVIHHVLLLEPALAVAYVGGEVAVPPWARLLTVTPLHLLWDGPAAAVVFFVLSGFVLTRPLLKDRMVDLSWWLAYYPQRLTRLYVPTWCSVLVALAWIWLFPRRPVGSGWLAGHAEPWQQGVVPDLTLLWGSSPNNSVLWSLQWEVWFSLLLPVFVALALLGRRFPWLVGGGALALLYVGGLKLDIEALAYLPTFLLGALLATNFERVLSHVTRGRQPLLLLAGLGLLNLPWWPVHVPARPAVQALGGVLVVVALLGEGPVSTFLRRPAVQWLGSRSFSLYLTHEPMVVSLGNLGLHDPALTLLVCIPLSLALAEAFFRLCERPSHRLSRGVAARVLAGLGVAS